MVPPIDLSSLLRCEQAVSAAINAVLSALFFAVVFGLAPRELAMGAPDGFALDFLPQGLMVSLMASLVPTLLVRARLRREGGASGGRLLPIVARGVLAGLASAVLLAVLALFGPVAQVPAYPALAFKIVYGALLGLACTRVAVSSLFAAAIEEKTA
ncbi:hypothetical protein [Novosphingobium gossypii]|uniref:hypothetical protein n=1 Tax=Novosphingobium gossypii TaxID=1604774 RepID=UPI003D1EE383